MTSIEALNGSGIVLDARVRWLLREDGTQEKVAVVVCGMNYLAPLTQQQSLPVPDLKVLVAVNERFAKADGFVGYAKVFRWRGHLARMHLLENRNQRRAAFAMQLKTRKKVVALLFAWLSATHSKAPHWSAAAYRMQARIEAYQQEGGEVTKLLASLTKTLQHFGRHHQARFAAVARRCLAAAAAGERALDRVLPVVYLFTHITKVTNAMYAYNQLPFKPVDVAPLLAPSEDVDKAAYAAAIVKQVQATAALFTAHKLPLHPAGHTSKAARWKAIAGAEYEAEGLREED